MLPPKCQNHHDCINFFTPKNFACIGIMKYIFAFAKV